MRKQRIPILVILTVAFAAFTLGFLTGRTANVHPVSVNVSQSMLTEPAPTETPETKQKTPEVRVSFPIDMNTASLDEWTALPGVGEVLARRILAYREEIGRFSSVEELLNVEGIGQKKMDEIWDLITIGG